MSVEEQLEAQKELLQREVERGKRASKAHSLYLKEFIEAKRGQLHLAFRECPVESAETLMEIKRLDLALASLEADILTAIESGRMASIQLGDDNLGDE